MQKPSAKWIIIFNVVLCVPMAIIMSISAALLAHQPLVFSNVTLVRPVQPEKADQSMLVTESGIVMLVSPVQR